MKQKILITSFLVVLVLASCKSWDGRSPEESNSKAVAAETEHDIALREYVSKLEAAKAQYEKQKPSLPTTRQLEIEQNLAGLQSSLTLMNEKLNDLKTANKIIPSTTPPPEILVPATGAAAAIPTIGLIVGSLLPAIMAGAWGELQRRRKQDAQEEASINANIARGESEKRLRQLQELVATVQIAGGLATPEKELAAMKIQSEDTINDVRTVKPQAVAQAQKAV